MKKGGILLEANWNDDQIEVWLKKMKITGYTINADKTVDVNGDVNLFNKQINGLPVTFGKVTGNFLVRHNKLTNLNGFPYEIGGDLSISHNPGIKNFQTGTNNIKVGGQVLMRAIKLNTLEGVSDRFSEISGPNCNFDVDDYAYEIKSGGLGLIQIKNVEVIRIKDYCDFGKAYVIIKKYMGTDNIIECQSEMIEAGGMDQYAIL